jgi:hypothetical protein
MCRQVDSLSEINVPHAQDYAYIMHITVQVTSVQGSVFVLGFCVTCYLCSSRHVADFHTRCCSTRQKVPSTAVELEAMS